MTFPAKCCIWLLRLRGAPRAMVDPREVRLPDQICEQTGIIFLETRLFGASLDNISVPPNQTGRAFYAAFSMTLLMKPSLNDLVCNRRCSIAVLAIQYRPLHIPKVGRFPWNGSMMQRNNTGLRPHRMTPDVRRPIGWTRGCARRARSVTGCSACPKAALRCPTRKNTARCWLA